LKTVEEGVILAQCQCTRSIGVYIYIMFPTIYIFMFYFTKEKYMEDKKNSHSLLLGIYYIKIYSYRLHSSQFIKSLQKVKRSTISHNTELLKNVLKVFGIYGY
jgi:hypothetical protein